MNPKKLPQVAKWSKELDAINNSIKIINAQKPIMVFDSHRTDLTLITYNSDSTDEFIKLQLEDCDIMEELLDCIILKLEAKKEIIIKEVSEL